MEILRFEQNDSNSTRRRRSSRVWVFLAFFGVVLGVGSAFASSTIAINSGNGVQLGQGVTLVTACDTSIGVKLQSGLDTSDPTRVSFLLKTLTLTGLDRTSAGCGGKVLDLQLFHVDGSGNKVAYTCSDVNISSSSIDPSTDVGNPNASCTSGIVSVGVPASTTPGANSANLLVTFTSAPSDISDITVVSRDA